MFQKQCLRSKSCISLDAFFYYWMYFRSINSATWPTEDVPVRLFYKFFLEHSDDAVKLKKKEISPKVALKVMMGWWADKNS